MTDQTLAPSGASPDTPFHAPHLSRRHALHLLGLGAVAAGAAALSTAPLLAHAQGRAVLRVGTQKFGPLNVLKARGALDQRLAAQGVDVKWTEFPSGPQLMEAMNVGSIDFGIVGEAPPIFALAAGTPLVYLFNDPPSPQGEAILVPKDSPLRALADLKGKKVALNKGSNVHYLLVKAVDKGGLRWGDIQPVYLAPADARAAFERGAVDAWAIWDPFFAAAQQQLGARVLADGTGIASNFEFYLATRAWAEKNPGVIQIIGEELVANGQWIAAHPADAAAIFARQSGLPQDVTALVVSRNHFDSRPVDAAVIASQQQIADVFADLKLIPKKLDVAQALLKR